MANSSQLEAKMNEMKELSNIVSDNKELAKSVDYAEKCYEKATGKQGVDCVNNTVTEKVTIAKSKEDALGAFCDHYALFTFTKEKFKK